jgi:tight adherence protein B
MPALIALFTALTVGFLLWALMYDGVRYKKRLQSRLDSVNQIHGLSKSADREQIKNTEIVKSAMRELEAIRRSRGRLTLQARLRQAGKSGDLRAHYLVWGFAAFIMAILTSYYLESYASSILTFLITLFVVPRVYLIYATRLRLQKVLGDFPNAIDIILRGLKSGLSLNDGLNLAESELNEPLKGELVRFRNDLNIGLSMEESAHRFARRLDSPEVNLFSTFIALQSKTGGNLSEGLSNLSKILRNREVTREKIKAASSESRTSAWIIGSIPVIVGLGNWIISPQSFEPMLATVLGNYILIGSGAWMVIGIFVMRSMVNIEV